MPNVTLYIWPGMEGLPTMSSFCLKPLLAAKAKGVHVDMQAVGNPPKWVTTGKLPAAMFDDQPVLDSTQIMKALDAIPSEKPALYPTDAALKAEVVLLEDWADEALFWYVQDYRWKIDQNFHHFSQQAFGKMAFPLRKIVPFILRKQLLKRAKAQGIGCLSEQDRDRNFKEICYALEQKLSGRSYFVGSHLTAADVAIYAQLKQVSHNQLNPGFAMMQECNNLMMFIERLDDLTRGIPTKCAHTSAAM